MKIFIASPLGFAESSKPFLAVLREKLRVLGLEPIDPWSTSTDLEKQLQAAETIPQPGERQSALHRIAMSIAERNAELLRAADGILAVLDGPDVDSGTASEIGYAFGLGDKVINGYRGDFRRAGEHDGVRVNLQVQYWIERSGGRIISSLDRLSTLSFRRMG